MNITVVGMGKIGLPLAVQFASKGHTVFGADVKLPGMLVAVIARPRRREPANRRAHQRRNGAVPR